MSVNVGQVNHFLSDGSRFYAYSGIVQGDGSVPASITLISIPNTGLKDSFVKIQPSFGNANASGGGDSLGISVLIDGVEVINQQGQTATNHSRATQEMNLFIPRQSSLTILSLNTSGNNTQERGVTMLGWCL